MPLVVRSVAFSAAGFDAALRRWTADGVDGVCCYNDEYAAGILAAAVAQHVDVPGQLQIVGVDDDPLSAVLRPGITTVALDHESAAAGLADLLLDEGAAAEPVAVRLVARGTTRPAAS